MPVATAFLPPVTNEDQRRLRLQAVILAQVLAVRGRFYSLYSREIKLWPSLPSGPGDQEAHGFGSLTSGRFSSMAVFMGYFGVTLF